MKPLVYLAGAIAGLVYDDATDWRLQAKHMLGERGIETLDPMRGKLALCSKNDGVVSMSFRDYEDMGTFFQPKGIMTRDFNDVRRCDALLVNLLGLRKPSLGTVMELAWAFSMQKPAIVAMESKGNPHDNHPMIHEAVHFRVSSMEEAIDAVAVVLNR